ncbi:MAG: histidine phosphatase family protein [Ruminococcaceae bacterium]|nr:histidine phosphatase family protein [Oscillospiraceae bacterium]
MKLYFIRHGKTQANEQHLYCGSTDISLSENGVKELSEKNYNIPPECSFITSGMKRTNETLKILFGDVVYTVDERLKEIDFGVFEMKSYDQLKDDAEYQQWITGDNENNVPPDGESGNMVKARVLSAVEEVMAGQNDTVIVTHGGVIAVAMEHLFSSENKNRYQWQPKPGEGYILENNGYTVLK